MGGEHRFQWCGRRIPIIRQPARGLRFHESARPEGSYCGCHVENGRNTTKTGWRYLRLGWWIQPHETRAETSDQAVCSVSSGSQRLHDGRRDAEVTKVPRQIAMPFNEGCGVLSHAGLPSFLFEKRKKCHWWRVKASGKKARNNSIAFASSPEYPSIGRSPVVVARTVIDDFTSRAAHASDWRRTAL